MADQPITKQPTNHKPDNFQLTHPTPEPRYDACWTCGESMKPLPTTNGTHRCIDALKHHIHRLEQEYGELKERALDAGITVRPFHI